MSLKIEGSGATEISQVYPFELPDTQKTIEDAYYEFYDPSVNISDAPSSAQRNIRWEISGSQDCTDLKHSYIVLRCNLARNVAGDAYALNGATAQDVVPAASRVSLAPNWSQLMIDRLNLYLNGVNLSEGDHYAYKGWIASILDEEEGWATEPIFAQAYGAVAPGANVTDGSPAPRDYRGNGGLSLFKQGGGEQEGAVLDYPGRAEENDFVANPSRRYTHSRYVASGGFTIMIRPRETLWLQDDFLIPQIKLKLEILTSAPNFWCLGDAGSATAPLLSIQSARLFLKRIRLTPSSEKSLLVALSQSPAKYLFPRMRYTNQVLGTAQSKQVVSLLPGPRPNRVIVFFTKTTASNPAVGNLSENPVAFTEFHNATNFVRRIYINVAGRQFPRKELEAVAKNDIHRAYEMYKMTCADKLRPLLSLDQFNSNYTIYCFNTTKTLMNDDEGVLHSGAMTDVQVNVLFDAVPGADVTMHCLSVDDGVVEVSSSGEVSKNY